MSDCKVKSSCTNLNGSTGEEGSFPRKSHIVCPTPPHAPSTILHTYDYIHFTIYPSFKYAWDKTYVFNRQTKYVYQVIYETYILVCKIRNICPMCSVFMTFINSKLWVLLSLKSKIRLFLSKKIRRNEYKTVLKWVFWNLQYAWFLWRYVL